MNNINNVSSETKANYKVAAKKRREITKTEQKAIDRALAILSKHILQGDCMTSPVQTRDFLKLHFAGKKHEVFTVLYLDNSHKPIAIVDEFRGTIDGASVYPREIVKEALKHNAGAVIFAHNHPSGRAEPSGSDECITKRLQDALGMVDIRVLDHFVVGDKVVSFAERGLI
jgi:DNA repair protein RadC